MREVDLLVVTKMAGKVTQEVWECKDYDHPVEISMVEGLVTRRASLRVGEAGIAARSGFQSGAISVAEAHNIRLLDCSILPRDPITWMFAKGRWRRLRFKPIKGCSWCYQLVLRKNASTAMAVPDVFGQMVASPFDHVASGWRANNGVSERSGKILRAPVVAFPVAGRIASEAGTISDIMPIAIDVAARPRGPPRKRRAKSRRVGVRGRLR